MILRKFGKRPEKVKLISEQVFLECMEGFRNVKECPKKFLENWKNSWESQLSF